MEEALGELGFDEVSFTTDHARLPERIREDRPEFVLHLAEYGFKGSHSLYCCQIPALLEQESIPFSNVGPRGMVLSSDKHLVNEVMRSVGVGVPEEVLLHRDDILEGKVELPADFRFPAFLKTRLNGGSVGISGEANVVEEAGLLAPSLRAVLPGFAPEDVRGENMDEWLLQEHLPGPEYSVGIVGNGEDLDVLPIGRLGVSSSILTYRDGAAVRSGGEEAGHSDDRYAPADLSAEEALHLGISAAKAYTHLSFRDYARFDFRRGRDGVLKLIDANALPGIYRGSCFLAMAEMRGQSFADLWREIVGTCFDRCFPGWRTR